MKLHSRFMTRLIYTITKEFTNIFTKPIPKLVEVVKARQKKQSIILLQLFLSINGLKL